MKRTTYKKIGNVSLVREPSTIEMKKVTNSSVAADVAREFFPSVNTVEYFYVMLLNRANKIMDVSMISMGGLSGTIVDIRVIMKTALDSLASSIVLVHNHPSGNTEPSGADAVITKKVQQAAKLFDIVVLEHIILTEHSYYSFADNSRV